MLWRPSRLDETARKLGRDFHGTFQVTQRRGLTTYVLRNLQDPSDVREASVRYLRPVKFKVAGEQASEGRMLELRDSSLPAEHTSRGLEVRCCHRGPHSWACPGACSRLHTLHISRARRYATESSESFPAHAECH